MQKKKLPVGLVVAFVVLVFAGIIINGAETMKTVGINLGKPPEAPKEMKAHAMTDAEKEAERKAMTGSRKPRLPDDPSVTTVGNPTKPALLIEPEVGNYKQTFNSSQTSAQWYRGRSYIDKKKRETEALRGTSAP